MKKRPFTGGLIVAGVFLTLGAGAAWAGGSPRTPVANPLPTQIAQAAPDQPAAAPEQPAAPTTVPYLAMGGVLTANSNPIYADTELPVIGKLYLTGAVSGLAFWQSHHVPGDQEGRADISNGQVFVQTTEGPVQFFVQTGIYSIPALATPYLRASRTNSNFFGPVPQTWVKVTPVENLSILGGKLPTLIGAETTFTFQNFNIERGLLWNLEPAVSQGLQANYTLDPLTFSLSWTDGFYSGRLNWVTGSIAYAFDSSNSISVVAGGNAGRTGVSTIATPLVLNNSDIVNWIYTGTSGPWSFNPYFQYTHVPRDPRLGIQHETSSFGVALMGGYAFDDNWKLAARAEYLATEGNAFDGSPNLLLGPGSSAWSITLTPTFQYNIFFARGEFSYVEAQNITRGFAFGLAGTKKDQARVLFEFGVLF